jgi:signal transduction histidine kinase
MAESTSSETSSTDSLVNEIKLNRLSANWWRPGKLLALIVAWICVAELTDILLLHKLTYSSGLIEGVIDTVVLCLFLSPAYFIFYKPLKKHWQQELKFQQEIRQLNYKLMVTAEEERRKLALELHDHFGQMVTVLQCKAERVQQQLAETVADNQTCQSLMETISQLGHDIRKFTSDLRPDMLDDLGLAETLKWYIDDLAQQFPHLLFAYTSVGIKQRLPAATEIALYRVCQEALNNIIKHANATHINVTLAYCHPLIILTVRDDGVGLPESWASDIVNDSDGYGLLGMRERLAAVGGSLELSSSLGEKTSVRALIPIKGEAESAWL